MEASGTRSMLAVGVWVEVLEGTPVLEGMGVPEGVLVPDGTIVLVFVLVGGGVPVRVGVLGGAVDVAVAVGGVPVAHEGSVHMKTAPLCTPVGGLVPETSQPTSVYMLMVPFWTPTVRALSV